MPQIAKLLLALVIGAVIGGAAIPVLKAQTAVRPAYVVAEIHVTDPAGFMAYVKQVPATLARFHARTLVRALPNAREGTPPEGDVVIIAFDSLRDADDWYSSEAYSALIPLRQKSATSRVYIVEGTGQ